jgi:cell division protein FtsL
MKLSDVVTRRVRGFRVLDLAALALVLSLALLVYAFKTAAGSQRSDIADIENQIHDQDRDVRVLRAQVAQLESPARLEKLAVAYAGQGPITARQEIAPDALPQVAQDKNALAPAATPDATNTTLAQAATNEVAQ